MTAVLDALARLARKKGERSDVAADAAKLIRDARGYRWVGLYDVTATEIVALAWTGSEAPAFPRFPKTRGLSGSAIATGRPVISQDVANDPRYLEAFATTGSEAIFPILDSTGTVVGTLDVESDRRDAFSSEDEEFLRECARLLGQLWDREVGHLHDITVGDTRRSTRRPAAKPYKGLAMEGVIASWYARNTARDLRRFSRITRIVTERVPPGSRILEVAPGPGYLAVEIARSGPYSVTGLDISHSFVRISGENAKNAGVSVDFQHGNAAQMPFSPDSFDFVVCVAAFKNFAEPVAALNEIHRVLRPGGHALIHDLRKDASLDDIDKEVGAMQLSTFNAAITRWVFRHVLLKSAYSSQALAQLVGNSRFGSADIRIDGIAIELRLHKDDQRL